MVRVENPPVNALDSRDAIALKQELQNHLCQPAWGTLVESVVPRTREHLSAVSARVALAVLALNQLPSMAVVAGHCESP